MNMLKPVAALMLAVLGATSQAQSQSQTMRPGSYGWWLTRITR